MSIKITIPNSSSDVLTFGSGNTPTAAQIAGIDSGSSNGQLALYTTASGTSTERVRVDSSGNVGIGTTSPSSQIHINGNADNYFTAGLRVNRYTTAGQYGTVNYANGLFNITAVDTALSGPTITFRTSTDGSTATERMRIDSSGNLLVRRTSALSSYENSPLQVEQTAANQGFVLTNSNAVPAGAYFKYTAASPNGTASEFLYCADSTTLRASLRSNGGLANFSANNVNLSDERTKTNIQNADSYLAKICAIPVRTFKYKDQTDDLLNLGVIAQEVETVAPELVDVSGFGETPEDGVPLKAVYQTDLQYALMKCIQEQQAIITSLTDRITALEGATS